MAFAQDLLKEGTLEIEEFLKFLDTAPHDQKWQLIDGHAWMMAGGTEGHHAIAINIIAALAPQTRKVGCRTYGSDLLVASKVDRRQGYFPDVFVRCGKADPATRIIDDPVAVVEVMSPSTWIVDHSLKVRHYLEMPTLQHLVYVFPNEMRGEFWGRADGEWPQAPDILTLPDDMLEFAAAGAWISLAEVYADIAFPPPKPRPARAKARTAASSSRRIARAKPTG